MEANFFILLSIVLDISYSLNIVLEVLLRASRQENETNDSMHIEQK